MVPVLLIANIVGYLVVRRTAEADKSKLANSWNDNPSNPLFDYDLSLLSRGQVKMKSCDQAVVECEDIDDTELQRRFEEWNLKEAMMLRELGSIRPDEEELGEGLILPDELIWCNGFQLRSCNKEDLAFFTETIANDAVIKGEYDGRLLEDSGRELLYLDWFRLKGASKFGAEQLLYKSKIQPWDWEGFC